eukprot:g25365.t1
MPAPTAPDTSLSSVTAADVRSIFLGVSPRKVIGLDGIPSRALGSCADQLTEVFTGIFNLSLLQARVSTCFKKTTIIPVPKKAHAMCLNDYHPVAVTSIIMKCFERLVMAHINSHLPACLEPLQFAYQCNRSTTDAISLVLHSSLEQVDNTDTYIRLLLIEGGAVVNNTIPSKLISKLKKRREHAPIYNNGTEVERVESVQFLGVTITNNLSWTSCIDAMVKKAQQCLFFRQLRKFGMSIRTLTNFYRCT